MTLDEIIPAIVASGIRLSAKRISLAHVSPALAIPNSVLMLIEGDPGRLKGVTIARSAWRLEVSAPLIASAALLSAIEENEEFLCSLVRLYKTHSWAPCDKCGKGEVIKRGNTPSCRETTGCTGHHHELDLLGERRRRRKA